MCVLQREGQRSRLLSQAAIWLRYDEYVVKGTQLRICGPCGIVNTRSLTCSCWVNIWPSIKGNTAATAEEKGLFIKTLMYKDTIL